MLFEIQHTLKLIVTWLMDLSKNFAFKFWKRVKVYKNLKREKTYVKVLQSDRMSLLFDLLIIAIETCCSE